MPDTVLVIWISYLVVGFDEDLIVFAESDEEHNRRHVLEAVNPLPALRSLTSNVNHPAEKRKEKKSSFKEEHR